MTSDNAFSALGLPEPLLRALATVGYETPSPIQEQAIPPLLAGHDLIGQAQTGTGKTGAFALPLIARVDPKNPAPQVLILTPTRELALQVAEACQSYAQHIPSLHVLPIYGGQSYTVQLRQLNRGAQIVVGTPGRIMDHMRRGTLVLDRLQALVLDEADEMLRMGFIDDVEWILDHTPDERQVALLSATLPSAIRRVAEKYLTEPKRVSIASETKTASLVRQRCAYVPPYAKFDALARVLDAEEFDAAIIFVRTRIATDELAQKLAARGHAAEPLHGDIPQNLREKVVGRLRDGRVDILIATDVAARGLDVPRVSHVINYDIPSDTESYVHRIGRTGRAGRNGDAILFATPRERRLVQMIERVVNDSIETMRLPTAKDVNKARLRQFRTKIEDHLADADLGFYEELLTTMVEEIDESPIRVAAALAHMAAGGTPLLLDEDAEPDLNQQVDRQRGRERDRGGRERDRDRAGQGQGGARRGSRDNSQVAEGLARYRVEVGAEHGVKPGNLVGAIANEAGIGSGKIGAIQIFPTFSLVDLPQNMRADQLEKLKGVWVCRRKLDIAVDRGPAPRKREGGNRRNNNS